MRGFDSQYLTKILSWIERKRGGFSKTLLGHTLLPLTYSFTFIIGREYCLILQALSISTQPGPGPGSRVSQKFKIFPSILTLLETLLMLKMLGYSCDTTCSSPSCRAPTPPNRLSTRRQDRVTMIQTTFPLPPSSRLGLTLFKKTALYSH